MSTKETTIAESDAAASEAAKKLTATIVKRSNETVERTLGVKVAFKPSGLATLIDMYLDDARKEGRQQLMDEQAAAVERDWAGFTDEEAEEIARAEGVELVRKDGEHGRAGR